MVLVTVCLAAFLLSHLAIGRALYNQQQANEMALASANEAAAARTVITTIDRLVLVADGSESRKTRTRLAWDVERLATTEDRRREMLNREEIGGTGAFLGFGSEPPMPGDAELSVAIDAVVTQGLDLARIDPPSLEAAQALSGRIENEILPALDLIAVTDRAHADLRHRSSLWTVGVSIATQLTALGCVFLMVIRPARRSIREWVAKSYENERENRFRLLHDPLTGMPNGAYLHAYISRLVAGEERRGTQTAVLRIDFDRFKVLRETLGTRVIEEVLRIAARRIQQTLRAGDFAAYLGNDDFVVVTGELADGHSVATIAQRLQAVLTKPFSVRGGAKQLSCSIGITLMSDDEADPDLILANAAIALSEAQAENAGLIRYFNPEQREEVKRRETLYAELVHGLEHGEIIAFFQPQIDLTNNTLAGFEALVRWEHPRDGLLTPAAFLDLAEQTDLTERLGEVVLTRSLEALTAWDAAGIPVPKVGVNFALAQLRNPRLIEKIKWDTERFDVDPDRLSIEVLETVLIKSDADMVVRNLRGLASAGFMIELDDFGTGHASISNLRRFMVNRIKIDRSFVLGIETSSEQQQLTSSMIAMARALGISTLAEGIETQEAQDMLKQLGCDFGQGYKIAKPMSLEATFDWLRSHCEAAQPEEEPDNSAFLDPNIP
ncbi:putative bifunctional diguanylate cyclase/phosphodiesterase [Amaricoccus macauensis]|uniref:putative bifunctional diguanylate cyclase/phosphodiesterase n=1 Tax=Amaricoccus macauensis TaxID=57001 RepID=UPI003C7B5864